MAGKLKGYKMAKELGDSRERYQNVYNTAPLAFVIWDRDCLITDWNDRAEKLFGWTKEEVIGRNFFELIIPEGVRPQIKKVVQNLLKGKLPSHSINENLTKSGNIILCEWNNSILYDKDGNIKEVISLALDITRRKKAENELKKAHDELEIKVKQRTSELEKINDRLIREVEERKLIESSLRQSEEKYRLLFENLTDVVCLIDSEYIIQSVSPSIENLLGYKSKDLINKDISNLNIIIQDYLETLEKDLKSVFKGENVVSSPCELITKGGKRKFFEMNFAPLKKGKNEISAICVARDISKRKEAEDALRESESQLRGILDASIDRIRYVDRDMKIIWANRAAASGLDCHPDSLIGKFCYKVYTGQDMPCEGCACTISYKTGKIEKSFLCKPKTPGKKGESFWETYCVPLKNNNGEINRYIQIARDITEEKHAEKRIHSLTQQLLKAHENERQKISRELHDWIAQNLLSIKINNDLLYNASSELNPEMRQKILENSGIIQDTITYVRNMAHDLRPPDLDQLGLVQTIFQYCEDFSDKTALEINFISAGMEELKLDFDTEINLYRLVQEALNNIHKHANAGHASIKLVASYPNLILRIADDGRGFDVKKRLKDSHNEKRMGISSMEERVSLLGGKIQIQSRPNEGTKITIKVPFNG